MNAGNLNRWRKSLVEREAKLRTRMNEMVDETLHHLADEGGVSADRDYEGYEEEVALAANERLLWEEVKAALARIEAVAYGVCEDCGAAIANSRLDVLPETRWCAHCANQHTASPEEVIRE